AVAPRSIERLSRGVQLHNRVAKLRQRVAEYLLVTHYQDHHTLERKLLARQRVDLLPGNAVDDLALPVHVVSRQAIFQNAAEESGLLPRCLVSQRITLADGRAHERQLTAGDTVVAEAADLIDHLPYRVRGAVCPDAGGSGVRSRMLRAGEEGT